MKTDQPQNLQDKIDRLEKECYQLQEKLDHNRQLLKQANDKLLQHSERSRLDNLTKSDFLANMSHEIRTPLNIILGMANLLAETALDRTQSQYLNSLRVTGRQLLEILNNILEFSRIEAGKITYQPEPFSLQKIINQIEASALPLCIQKQIRFNVKQDPLLVMERVGDSLKIFQILLNLTNNAIKFTEAGSITLIIEEDFKWGGDLLLSVQDTGIGVSEDQQKIIFDRFTQANESLSQQHRGAGLGLAICDKLTNAMSGELTVTSKAGYGSTFSCRLPLPPVAPSERRAVRIDASMILPENFPAIKILAVDDVRENLEVMKVYLEQYPVEIDTAEHGEEALTLLEYSSYDLILMDVRMPVMDGITATKKIRAREKTRPGRTETILAITAHAFQEQKNKFLEDGFDGVLTKPFFKRDLVQALYRFMSTDKTVSPPAKMGNKALGYCLEHEKLQEIPSSLKKMLPDLYQTISSDFKSIQTSLKASDLEAVYTTVHSLKGVSGMFGFHQLSSLITDFSHSVKSRNFTMAGELLTALKSYIDGLEQQIKQQDKAP
ncbi:MAG: response regulator [Desulfobulbaceae bacterium]|nr:response regulator [Desulfobulbaceae bacterium]